MKPPTQDLYSADYYGMSNTPSALYRNYGPHSVPHWSMPLAQFLRVHAKGPFLDVGGAYGHLCRDINALIDREPRLSDGRPATSAQAVDWSQWAYDHRVTPMLQLADARALPFPDNSFNTVTSLDFLEHFEPAETQQVMREMVRVGGKDHFQIHLIGWHNPEEADRCDEPDPTHRNFEPYDWYVHSFQELGCAVDYELIDLLNTHPTWKDTDWRGRWLAARHVG